MKQIFKLGLAIVVTIGALPLSATTLYYEPFPYAGGTQVTTLANFKNNSGTAGTLQTTSTGLSYTLSGYPASSGNSLVISQALTEDALTTLTAGAQQVLASPGTTVSVYMSAQVNMITVPSTTVGTYFIAMLPTDSNTNYQARVFARQDSVDSTKFNFGIQVGSAGVVFESTQRSLNTTYLIVDRLDMVDGATNDTARLYVNPASSSVEPASPTIICTTPPTVDVPGINKVGYRQATAEGVMQVDEVRVGDTYPDALGFAGSGVEKWSKY